MFEKTLGNPEWRKNTKAKAKVAGRRILAWAPWIATGLTISAAWEGYSTSRRNEREIRQMQKWARETEGIINEQADVISYNARCGNRDHAVLVELTKDNQELLDRALAVTEGKEPEKKEEPAA